MSHAIVTGSARCLFDDLWALPPRVIADAIIIGVNRSPVFHGLRLDHWVSLHPNYLHEYMVDRIRAHKHANQDYLTWAHICAKHFPVDCTLKELWGGGSGLLAVQLALMVLEVDRVILVGMPIDDQPYVKALPRTWATTEGLKRYRAAWSLASIKLGRRIRSMSGWTAERFESPSDWIEQGLV